MRYGFRGSGDLLQIRRKQQWLKPIQAISVLKNRFGKLPAYCGGNIDASEYKSVVLGLIFLKYISDHFEAKYNELVAEGEGFEENKD